MPVQIVSDDEKKYFIFEGGKFFYRRPPLKMQKKWSRETTDRYGNSDGYALAEKAIPTCLLGWEPGAVVDANDKNVAYSLDAAMMLPIDFYLVLIKNLGIAEPDNDKKEQEAKN